MDSDEGVVDADAPPEPGPFFADMLVPARTRRRRGPRGMYVALSLNFTFSNTVFRIKKLLVLNPKLGFFKRSSIDLLSLSTLYFQRKK